MSGRKLARRACDGCKIRKIKCDEKSPCSSCTSSSIPCTWLKQAQPRGPRKLRESTLQEIKRTQRLLHQPSPENHEARNSAHDLYSEEPDPPPPPSSEISNLVLRLCMYRLQLYSLWPIIKVERLIASLQSAKPDIEVFAMAYALAAATLAQLKCNEGSQAENAAAATMEARCQAAKGKCPSTRPPNVTTVRVAFFLHLYHENQEPGGMKSMLYLREAIAIAQMIGLHRESYYRDVRIPERQIRRRILWLLYVAEREVAILHKQPVALKTKIDFPSTEDSDEAEVLSGFQKLVSMFWAADEAGLFEALELTEYGNVATLSEDMRPGLANLQQRLASGNLIGPVVAHNAQGLNLSVTCQWLQATLWRLIGDVGVSSINTNSSEVQGSRSSMDDAASTLASTLKGVSASVMQIHGSDMRLKIFEIARALIDSHRLASLPDYLGEEQTLLRQSLSQLYRHLLPEPKLAVSLHFEAMKLGDKSIAAMLEEIRTTGHISNEESRGTPNSKQGEEYTSPYGASPASNDSGHYIWLDQPSIQPYASGSADFVNDTGDWTFTVDADMNNSDAQMSSNILDDLTFPMNFTTSNVFEEPNF